MEKDIAGKTLVQWKKEYPLIEKLMASQEILWANPKYGSSVEAIKKLKMGSRDVEEAEERLERFAPYIARVFPETRQAKGLIESPLVRIPKMQRKLEYLCNQKVQGELLLKCDSHLPIAGSIKARGGIYEVLKHAEDLAIHNNLLRLSDDYSVLDNDSFKDFFSQYSIAVGSTGNLGLSIGIMSAKLGFRVTVHMSADAKQWKKDMLRSKGVIVVEYASDYSKAVDEGRKQSNTDPKSYFIDDEKSKDLFLGYAVAANRLKRQLEDMEIMVDENHPLFVYLPCGVGGGPGGVTFGLKLIFQDNVHCFFSEPTHAPAMLLGLMTGLHDQVSVGDFGIDNITDADGLAVGRPSGFVGRTLENLISGVFTVNDDSLYLLLSALSDSESIQMEPSSLAGLPGIVRMFKDNAGQKYLEERRLIEKMKNANHISWATGGSMVPNDVMETYYQKGILLITSRQ